MIKYFETEKGYRRVKTSIYLRKNIYDRLDKISRDNELSLSECAQRLLQKGMGNTL